MINIALNTFKEIIRNKFMYLIIFFALVFIIFSLALGKLTIWDDQKVIVDFGLAMIEIFSFISVLFVGSQLLFKEVEGKTIFLILSKPINRYEFILWKFLGFSIVIFLVVLLQSLLYIWVLLFKGIPVDNLIVWALFFTYLKLEILLSIVIFLSTFMSNILTILVSVIFYFIAHSFSVIIDLVIRIQNEFLLYWVKTLQVLFPPFEAINLKDSIWSFSNFPLSYLVWNTFYSLFYLALILFFTVLIFNKKNFEN